MTTVPATQSFADVYPKDAQASQAKRWNNLLAAYSKNYGCPAQFVSRSPGRVNIIGEHVDYSLYECMPMAITADVLIGVSVTSESRVRIANSNSASFPSREFEISGSEIPIDSNAHDWSNYFKAGMRGASQLLQKKGKSGSVGMDLMIDGTVPAGGGLSSSAAFVCASALATLWANGETEINKTELVELAIISERAVGVNSGGLDQSASVLSLRDSALLVSFVPTLTASHVKFPAMGPELVFVIAQSFVVSNKQVTAPVHYNLRVVECTLAALVLARIFRLKTPLPDDAGPLGVSLRGFHDTYFQEKEGISDNRNTLSSAFAEQLETVIDLVENYLSREDGYSREDLATILDISVDELTHRYMTKVPIRAERFMLRQRALHVFSEALRVQKFYRILSSSTEKADEVPGKLGALLVETQTSCRELYECSCPELDELCQIALDAGAWGGRLTGAGWGGCSVHLVPQDKVDAVTTAWKEKYYSKRFPDLSQELLNDAIVVSRPGNGSLVWDAAGRTTV